MRRIKIEDGDTLIFPTDNYPYITICTRKESEFFKKYSGSKDPEEFLKQTKPSSSAEKIFD